MPATFYDIDEPDPARALAEGESRDVRRSHPNRKTLSRNHLDVCHRLLHSRSRAAGSFLTTPTLMTQLHKVRAALSLVAIALAACSSDEASSSQPATATDASSLVEDATTRRLRAGFLIVDGVYNTELTAPWDVLEHTTYHLAEGLGIDVFTVSLTDDPVTTAEGLKILPDYSVTTAPKLDILVVPSARSSRDRDLENRTLIDWVRRQGRQTPIVMSLCWGAFVLAEADLLDGRAATTFPSDYGTFARRFAEVDLRVNLSFVHDGRVLTSQGGARSFDVAMYLVDLLYGRQVAAGIGSGLLIPWPMESDSGVSYYVARR